MIPLAKFFIFFKKHTHKQKPKHNKRKSQHFVWIIQHLKKKLYWWLCKIDKNHVSNVIDFFSIPTHPITQNICISFIGMQWIINLFFVCGVGFFFITTANQCIHKFFFKHPLPPKKNKKKTKKTQQQQKEQNRVWHLNKTKRGDFRS